MRINFYIEKKNKIFSWRLCNWKINNRRKKKFTEGSQRERKIDDDFKAEKKRFEIMQCSC